MEYCSTIDFIKLEFYLAQQINWHADVSLIRVSILISHICIWIRHSKEEKISDKKNLRLPGESSDEKIIY